MQISNFLKDWTLIIAILAGVAGYFVFTALPLPLSAHAAANRSGGDTADAYLRHALSYFLQD